VPVSGPAPGGAAFTVAVNVTDWPNTEGFADELTAVVVSAGFTVWVKLGEVLPLKLTSPLYTAVTVAVPTVSVDTDALVALPPLIATALPKFTPLVWNWTVPVGVPTPGAVALTIAVNVTDWPNTEGLADELTAVVVSAGFTVCVKVGEALPLKLASPL
jgi:hypothetical protein